MKTLVEEEQSTATTISFPVEIMEDILSRLPIKSILRFRSVSKPWLSLISHPPFTKLHFIRSTAAHRSAFFFSVYDYSTHRRHFLSAAIDGGPVTHLTTLPEPYPEGSTQAEHLNGLLFFTCVTRSRDIRYTYDLVINPSTRNAFRLPHPYTNIKGYVRFLFGFDVSRNEHKILSIKRKRVKPVARFEFMVFSMSKCSWRKIDAEPPIGFRWEYYHSVCVNSVIHLTLLESYDILGFDLRTEKFLIVNAPQGVLPCDDNADMSPYVTKFNGCVGIVCGDHVLENNELHIWILQDYENRVWVKNTITLPKPWTALDCPLPRDSVNMDRIIFFSSNTKVSRNVITVFSYNMKTRYFRSLQFTLAFQFPFLKTMRIDQIKCYAESMLPL